MTSTNFNNLTTQTQPYNINQNQTAWSKFLDAAQPFIVGAFSGLTSMAATCITQPIDMVKVNIQIKSEQQHRQHSNISPFAIAREIYKAEGLRGFYRGIDAALVRQIVYSAARFGAYKTATQFIKRRNERMGKCTFKLKTEQEISFFQRSACALFAGFNGALIANPADLILVRMQADARLTTQERRNYKHVFDALKRIINEEGYLSLWRGATPTVIRAMALNLGMLVSYDEIKQRILKYWKKTEQTLGIRLQQNILQLSSSLIAGFFASFICLPFDNAKTKMQKMKRNADGSFPYRNIFDAMVKTIRNEGFTHLWVGLPTFYCRLAPHVCITLVSQDLFTDFMQKLRGKNH